MKRVYLIGSLRNPVVPEFGRTLRRAGLEVFDDWHAAGPEADDHWQKYEQAKGNNFIQALKGAAAQHVFAFDRENLDASDAAVLILPAGKSGHLELGYMAGKGKKTYILIDKEPDRFDVMYGFATGVYQLPGLLVDELKRVLA